MRLRGVIIVGAILSVTVGFVLGRTVVANSPAPGSNADPVVSKSYVDKAMQDRVEDLEKKVAELMVQAQALQTTINEVQSKTNIKPSTSSTSTPEKSTTTEKPTTPEKPADPAEGENDSTEDGTKPGQGSVIGKTAYINAKTSVNLRSAPTTDASIIGKVTKDDALVIQKEENKWYNVKLKDGTVGWVAGWLVTVK